MKNRINSGLLKLTLLGVLGGLFFGGQSIRAAQESVPTSVEALLAQVKLSKHPAFKSWSSVDSYITSKINPFNLPHVHSTCKDTNLYAASPTQETKEYHFFFSPRIVLGAAGSFARHNIWIGPSQSRVFDRFVNIK